ncbi:MAG: hypothetical protein A3J47_02920 [Candidatus Yanofskybacteria bacterium RIFCSPHIGHO2_02_FULL_43_22]|uniref:Bulb-type lectin domain-containing protein n=2 Tax=Candidatus Yanofskyibacteriota TaxID=1752733 RepID=A0A1F8FKG7_9BACT|nr:MAG: hypothetical protein A3J47_02920 [Candidatus Yanofskybacteria bacterium RIFCSPHIGHO2_02_FULL_43_22]
MRSEMRKNNYFVAVTLVALTTFWSGISASAANNWVRFYDTGQDDFAGGSAIIALDDGSIIVGGATVQPDAPPPTPFTDSWLMKVSPSGEIEWQRRYGAILTENEFAIAPIAKGGYMAAVRFYSYDPGQGGNVPDAWILKLDENGTPITKRIYDSGVGESVQAIASAPDGTFYMVGTFDSVYIRDFWVVKVNPADGRVFYQKKFYSLPQIPEFGMALGVLPDGSAAIGGTRSSGALTGDDIVVFRLSGQRDIHFAKAFHLAADYSSSLVVAKNSIVVAGVTTFQVTSGTAFVILNLDFDGKLRWVKKVDVICPYPPCDELNPHILATSDGGFLLAGTTNSVTTPAFDDVIIVKLDKDGWLEWAKIYGDGDNDRSKSVIEFDGGFVVVADGFSATSTSRDVMLISIDPSSPGCEIQDITSLTIVSDVAGFLQESTVTLYQENTRAKQKYFGTSETDTTAVGQQSCP